MLVTVVFSLGSGFILQCIQAVCGFYFNRGLIVRSLGEGQAQLSQGFFGPTVAVLPFLFGVIVWVLYNSWKA